MGSDNGAKDAGSGYKAAHSDSDGAIDPSGLKPPPPRADARSWPSLGGFEQHMLVLVLLGVTFLLMVAPLGLLWSGASRESLATRYREQAHGDDGLCYTCKGKVLQEAKLPQHDHAMDLKEDHNWVLQGGMHGLLVMLATVVGGIGADVPGRSICAVGIANLVASSFSIGFGTFMSESAKEEFALDQLMLEYNEVRNVPGEELEEMVCHYMRRGLSEEDARSVAATFSKYEDFWVQHMMQEELGIQLPRGRDATIWAALSTGMSFAFFGLIPLLGVAASVGLLATLGPTWYRPQFSTMVALSLTGATLVLMGISMSRWAGSPTLPLSGLLMFVNGCVASLAAFLAGQVCSRIGRHVDERSSSSASAPMPPEVAPVAIAKESNSKSLNGDSCSTGGTENPKVLRRMSSEQADKVAWPSFGRRFLICGCVLLAVACLFIVGMQLKKSLGAKGDDSIRVFLYGMLTCVTTGLGAVPFFFMEHDNVDPTSLAMANTVAGGMMLAASSGMLMESHEHCGAFDWQLLSGLLAGALFIKASEALHGEEESEGELEALHTAITGRHFRKAMLIFTVMFCHSAAEGVAVGVSFSRELQAQFGMYVSLLLAVHNVPEGLAVALVLVPRGVSTSLASLIAMLTSVPQPLLAVVAYLFVDVFRWLLPVGLAFAGGAMIYVSFHELLMEASEQLGWAKTSLVTVTSFLSFSAVQFGLQILTGAATDSLDIAMEGH